MAEALGASFSIDVTDLKAGLAAANRAIRESNSEWQAAAAGMDDASNSIEGIEANIKRINKNIPVQSEVVRALTEEYNRLLEKGIDPSSKQMTELRTKINDATKSLNESEKQLREAKQRLEEVQEESEESGEGFKEFGRVAAAATAKAAKAITVAIAGAVASFLALAESTRESRTELAKLKQNAESAGVGFENIQDKISDVTSVTGDAGAAMEGLNMLMATGLDTSQIEYAADAFTAASMKFDGLNFEAMSEGLQESLAVGEAVGGFAELIERNGDSLEDFNAGLAATTSEAEKQQYVMDYLAKSGLVELGEAYKENNKDLVEANKAAYDMEQAMNELGAIAEPITTIFKNIGTTLLQGVIPYVEKFAAAIQSFSEGDITKGFVGLEMALSSLPKKAGAFVEQIVAKVGELVPNVLTLITKLISSVVTTLGSVAPRLLPQLAGLLSTVVQSLINNIPRLLEAAKSLFLGIVQAIPPTIVTLLGELPKIIDSILTALSEAIPLILDAAEMAFFAIIDALPSLLAALGENLPSILQKIIDFLTNAAPELLKKAIDVLMNIVRALPTVISSLAQSLPEIIATITGTLIKNVPNILSAAVKMLWGVISAVPQIVKELGSKVPQIVGSIKDGLAKGIEQMKEAGKEMLRGLWAGIESLAGWIWDKISGFFNNTIVGGIKALLGIASPSKVFAEMGAYSAQGYAEGFEDSMDEAKRGIYDAMDFDPRNPHSGGTGGSAGFTGSGRVVYFTQNNYSPKALSRVEIYRQTKNAAGLIAQGG